MREILAFALALATIVAGVVLVRLPASLNSPTIKPVIELPVQ